MTKTFKVRIGDLVSELFAHALGVFGLLETARTVAAFLLQAFLDRGYDFLIGVQFDPHAF